MMSSTRWKNSPQNGRKSLKIISDKGFVSTVYKYHLQLSSSQSNVLVGNRSEQTFSKKIHRWPIRSWQKFVIVIQKAHIKLPGRGISQTSGRSESKGGVSRVEQLESTHNGGKEKWTMGNVKTTTLFLKGIENSWLEPLWVTTDLEHRFRLPQTPCSNYGFTE